MSKGTNEYFGDEDDYDENHPTDEEKQEHQNRLNQDGNVIEKPKPFKPN